VSVVSSDAMAVTDTLAAEDRVLREACGIVDRSERGKLALTGSEAKAFLHGQVTQDIEALEPGTGAYAAFLTHKGKMLGDLRVLVTDKEELLLDTERAALQELFNMIRRFKLGMDVELHKRTLETGLLSLVGPGAREIAGADLPEAEHANAQGEIAGHPVTLAVTDAGIDVFCAAEHTADVRAALEAAGAVPVSEAAAEVLRVESGRPRWGLELDDSVIPQEAGLNDRAVSFTKGCYVGQETVARLHYRGKPNRHLRGLRLPEPVAPGTPVTLGEREIGRVASAVVSPRLGPIALAILRREAEPGATVDAGGVAAEVVALPF
jgi:folate-binding protein YgfZ